MASHSTATKWQPGPPPGVVSRRGHWSTSTTPTGVKAIRLLLVLALVPLSFYLAPRVINLVVTPDRLDQTIVHANAYNPGLHQLVEHEKVTLASLKQLDSVDASLRDVRATVAKVNGELVELINRIRTDVQNVLDLSNAQVETLLARLATLESRLSGLNGPIGEAAEAVQQNRAQLARIIKEGRATGSDVDAASDSANNSADNVDGGR